MIKSEGKADNLQLSEWFNSCIDFDLESEVCVADLYKNYVNYVLEKSKVLPASRRTFILKVKSYLKQYINENQVKFFYKKESKVLGLTITKGF